MNKKERIFETVDGQLLKVAHRKSALFLELVEDLDGFIFHFSFDKPTFVELVEYIDTCAHEAWKEINVKEADSLGNDYFEYYSREYNNNGTLSFYPHKLVFNRPTLLSKELYKFNKAKIGTFLFDARDYLQLEEIAR